jgi:hypothetical protein
MCDLLVFPPDTLLAAVQVFLALSVGHAIADFPLQGEFLATCKNRHVLKKLDDPLRPPSIWLTCMLVHCVTHAGAVWLITGSFLFGVIELVLHFIIDVLKCEGYTDFNMDQILHIACKVVYVIVAYAGWLGCCCG